MLKLTSNIHHIHDVFLHRTFMAGNGKALTTLLVSLLLLTLLPMPSTAQGPPGSISMECSDDPVMDVKPGEYEDETVECTVTNDGSVLAENVEITQEWDGVFISMSISEDSFTLEAGDLISFGTTGKGTDKFPRGHKSLLIGEQKGLINIRIEKLGMLSNPIKHQKGGA